MLWSERPHREAFRRTGALVTLLSPAAWGLGVLWFHLITPAGADPFEISYMGALTATTLVLAPLYA